MRATAIALLSWVARSFVLHPISVGRGQTICTFLVCCILRLGHSSPLQDVQSPLITQDPKGTANLVRSECNHRFVRSRWSPSFQYGSQSMEEERPSNTLRVSQRGHFRFWTFGGHSVCLQTLCFRSPRHEPVHHSLHCRVLPSWTHFTQQILPT